MNIRYSNLNFVGIFCCQILHDIGNRKHLNIVYRIKDALIMLMSDLDVRLSYTTCSVEEELKSKKKIRSCPQCFEFYLFQILMTATIVRVKMAEAVLMV